VIPSRATRSISATAASSSRSSAVPSVAVAEMVYTKGSCVGTILPVTPEARPVLTRA
jgi:hypothetical protein